MSFKPSVWRQGGYTYAEIIRLFKEYMTIKVAKRLPKSVIYWSFINVGIDHIKDNEIVPEVKYTEILQRLGYEVRVR